MVEDVESATPSPGSAEKGHGLSLTLDLMAALLLAISVTIITDFSRRLLGSDPDSWGICAVAVQAMFAVAATSTFTQAGWAWLAAMRRQSDTSVHDRSRWRFGLSLLLAILVIAMWYVVPAKLANYYNARGYDIYEHDPANSAEAFRDYQRAIALNPVMHQPYVNLGGLLEDYYRYGDAAEQYRRAITAEYGDPTPYNNLARVLLLDGDSLTALRVVNAALKLKPDATAQAALYKNRAWAELNLGFNNQAIADATQSKSAAGDCILGKVYLKVGDQPAAQRAWASFKQRNVPTSQGTPVVEPDCVLLAENSNEKK
jgi:tetratricopeptide (TPR) repeat protein